MKCVRVVTICVFLVFLPNDDQYYLRHFLVAARAGHALAQLGNKIYIFAGYRTTDKAARESMEGMQSDAWAVNLPPTTADAERHCVALLRKQERQEEAHR